jgi:hypothetical protein
VKNINLQILADLQVLVPSEYKKCFLVCCLSVCRYVHWYVRMHVCMYRSRCTSLGPERLDGFYSVFKSLSVISRCPMNTNILAPKTGYLQIIPKTQNGDFHQVLVICGDHLPTYNCTCGTFRNITVRVIGAQMRNVQSSPVQ